MNEQDIRQWATAAWQEAWWGKVPHTQLGTGYFVQAGSLKWYW